MRWDVLGGEGSRLEPHSKTERRLAISKVLKRIIHYPYARLRDEVAFIIACCKIYDSPWLVIDSLPKSEF